MCIPKSKKSPTPAPAPAPAPPAPAPTEIENAVDSNSDQQKKKRRGTKQLRRGNSRGNTGVQVGSSTGGNNTSGLTINK